MFVVLQHFSMAPEVSGYDFLDHGLTKCGNTRHWSCQVRGGDFELTKVHGVKLSLALSVTSCCFLDRLPDSR